jgi:biotin carboxyl carrier protein
MRHFNHLRLLERRLNAGALTRNNTMPAVQSTLATPSQASWHLDLPRLIHVGRAALGLQVKVPPLGESITDGSVAAVLKKPGDTVEEDEPIVQIETDKVTIDVRAPAAGILEAILVKENDNVAPGHVVASIAERGNAMRRVPASVMEPAAEQATESAVSSFAAPVTVRKYKPGISFPDRRAAASGVTAPTGTCCPPLQYVPLFLPLCFLACTRRCIPLTVSSLFSLQSLRHSPLLQRPERRHLPRSRQLGRHVPDLSGPACRGRRGVASLTMRWKQSCWEGPIHEGFLTVSAQVWGEEKKERTTMQKHVLLAKAERKNLASVQQHMIPL